MGELTEVRDPAAVESRGSLNVRAQALQHIVESVALEVPGVHLVDGGLAGVRPGSPRASVRVRGTSARVQIEVACRWPAPVSRIAADVRRHVLDRASELSGVRLASVDVTVGLDGTDERRAS
ncbi:hypothetical protein Pve01_95600 [Planomonospora venezuelensis]|nr:hypothetical protein Pve01_95600 [Planomonospora venezuelensis]